MGENESCSTEHRECFRMLWELHHEQVARFVSRRLPGDDEVADVVSDTYLVA
jgi:DNA-directed RNA polymerase specialized sigma24 family protein